MGKRQLIPDQLIVWEAMLASCCISASCASTDSSVEPQSLLKYKIGQIAVASNSAEFMKGSVTQAKEFD